MKTPAASALATRTGLLRGVGRWRPLRSMRLNLAGWAALIGVAGLGAGLAGVLALAAGSRPWVGACGGAASVLLVVVILDRRRYGRSPMTLSWTSDLAEVEAGAAVARLRGVAVRVVVDPPALTFKNRDEHLVRRALGLPLPAR